VLGTTLFHLGEFASSRAHCEQGLALYAPQQHRSLAYVYGQDPGVLDLYYTSGVLWLFGYPDQALRRNHEAMALASELSHPYSLAFAFSFAAAIHVVRREARAAQERAEAAIALSREQGFSYFLAWGLRTMGQNPHCMA
jgi:predicted ATPase